MRGGNMKNMMKQMQKMQQEMEQSQASLNETIFKGVANDDLIVIEMNGQRKVQSVSVKEDVAEMGDHELLEDLILIAFNDALEKVDTETEKVMGKYTKNLNIPGF